MSWGTNRQEAQFSEFTQTRFAPYMQRIPKEATTCIIYHTKSSSLQ